MEDTLITSESFATVLNSDDVVQIGNWIFKIDAANELVYALNQNNLSHYNKLLTKDTSGGFVLLYSIDSDVLDLLEDGVYQDPSLSGAKLFGWGRCKGKGCGRGFEEDIVENPVIVERYVGRMRYSRFGVYFELKLKGISQTRGIFAWSARAPLPRICVDFNARWVTSCGVQGQLTGTCQGFGCNNCSFYTTRPYSGTRKLTSILLEATFSFTTDFTPLTVFRVTPQPIICN